MSVRNRKSSSSKSRRRGLIPRIGSAAFLAASGGVFALSLYYPPSFGLLGQELNSYLLSWFGWLAYLFPVFLVWSGYRFWHYGSRPESLAAYLTASLLVPAVGFAIAAMAWGLLVFEQRDISGSWGWAMAHAMAFRTGFLGAFVLTIAAAMLWAYAVFGVPWLELARELSRWVRKDLQSWWSAYQESRRLRQMVKKSVPEPAPAASDIKNSPEPEAREVSVELPAAPRAVKNGKSHAPAHKNGSSRGGTGKWKLPSLDLFLPGEVALSQASEEELFRARAENLVRALASFDVQVTMDGIVRGPVVTRFDVVPQTGVKVGQIEALVDDIALAMKVESVRIVGLIAGKGAIGIEVPNPKRQMVRLRETLEDPDMARSGDPLLFGLGRLANGKPIFCNLANMPHLLVAGATNSGKSVMVHSIVASFLFRLTPDDLKLVLIDPKRLELPFYDGIPHLFDPRKNPAEVRVITDSKDASKALASMVDLMEARYERFSEQNVRNIASYNEKARKENFKPEPYVVIIIDELADMMLVAGKEVENSIQRLAQMARAVGIHLVLATQRPSTDVITGVIKANLPARIALQVVSNTDSRVILDTPGAEDLLGAGDMLYLASGSPKPVRVQSAYVGDDEIKRLVQFWKDQGEPEYDDPADLLGLKTIPGLTGKISKEDEENIRSALRLVLERKRVSQDLLKDHFRTSSKASDVLSRLEVGGFIFKPEGSNRWEIRYDRIEAFLNSKPN